MADIIYFKPQVELDAGSNLKNFIDQCRNESTVFGPDLPFDENIWDITDYLNLKGHGNKRHRVVFSTLKGVNDKNSAPMPEPFLRFAKSYYRYMQGVRPVVDYTKRLTALRAVSDALTENGGRPDPVRIDALILNRASQMVDEKYSGAVAYRIGVHLEMLAKFLSDNRLTIVPVDWRNFLKRPGDTVRVGKEFDERRQSKLPSEAALEALPKVFRLATEPVDVIVSSVAAILCSAPDRISEVLMLRVNCEVNQERGNDKEDAYGLRWWPAKGADPMVKWIVPSLSSVVKEAISKIKAITEEARRIAKWYEDNPGCLYLSTDLEYLRGKKWLSMAEVAMVIGLKNPESSDGWCRSNKLKKDKISKCVKFEDVQNVILYMLPKWFPLLDPETGLKYSDALLVYRTNEIGTHRATYNCMIESISIGQINTGLGGRSDHGFGSIFSRLGFTEPNGSPIKISTHQFRHYLNTLAQMGGMSQLDIAKWSGRKNVSQNSAYDHVTPDQMLAKIRDAIGDESQMFGPLAEIPQKVLIPRDEFAILKVPTAHTTDFGFCIHDYTMTPCQIHMDCIHCEELICVKGDEENTERLRKGLAEARKLMEHAKNKVDDGYAGSDRWLEHHISSVERLSQLCSIMDDPKVPIGSIIQLAPPKRAKQLVESLKLPES